MNQNRFNFSFLTSHFSPLTFLLTLTAGLFYLAVSTWGYGYLGFPLDDAWIHQTYARNLALSGQLAFVPGQPSAGSTAPLWSLLLSLGYIIGIPFQLWSYGLGIILLGFIGAQMSRLAQTLWPQQTLLAVTIGVACTLEWHMVWAAVSGMETLLFMSISVALVNRYFTVSQAPTAAGWLSVGLMGGLLILTRPEGIGLIGLLGLSWGIKHTFDPKGSSLTLWVKPRNFATPLASWGMMTLGVALLILPYMAFHFHLTGKPFPNTLYAKQAEYAVVLSSYPLWWRLFGNFSQPVETVQGVFQVIFIGPQLLLLPGLIWAGWLTIKERRAELVPLWGWWISFLLLYGLRLPVTYQHGRYQMPMIVWIILLGMWGSQRLCNIRPYRFSKPVRSSLRVFYPVMVSSYGLLIIAFLLIGAQAYGRDVQFIETEMVATARWLAAHTPPHTTLAAHDIGAIGYFTQRSLIDLAGLVTPDVIPIIRDEPQLLTFIMAHQVDYVIIFPSWYPHLSQAPQLQEIYRTETPYSRGLNNDNMRVYQVETADNNK